jgi:hypothetical protein
MSAPATQLVDRRGKQDSASIKLPRNAKGQLINPSTLGISPPPIADQQNDFDKVELTNAGFMEFARRLDNCGYRLPTHYPDNIGNTYEEEPGCLI